MAAGSRTFCALQPMARGGMVSSAQKMGHAFSLGPVGDTGSDNRSSHANVRYEDLLVDGAQYVFDGNRVIAHWRVAKNGVGRWRLYTINRDVSLVVTPDLRVRKYRWNGRTCRVGIIRSLGTVFNALRPLVEAVSLCAQSGHAWGPNQDRSSCVVAPYTWQWCLICGAELVSFGENGNVLTFPDDANEIAARTGGALPTLHAPVLRGTRSEELRLP
jgi:hypothetical protein